MKPDLNSDKNPKNNPMLKRVLIGSGIGIGLLALLGGGAYGASRLLHRDGPKIIEVSQVSGDTGEDEDFQTSDNLIINTEIAGDEDFAEFEKMPILLCGVDYVSGSGATAVNEYSIYVSPEAVSDGLNLGDLWAVKGNGPVTEDNANMIQTYMGDEAADGDAIIVYVLPNGGKLIKWRTELYLMEGDIADGDVVTIGANLAGQDADGQWQENPISTQATVVWGPDMANLADSIESPGYSLTRTMSFFRHWMELGKFPTH